MGTCYSRHSVVFVLEFETLLEYQYPAVSEWLERCNVTTIEPAPDAGAPSAKSQLKLGRRTGPQARFRFHQRGAAADVQQHDRLSRPKYRIGSAPHAAGRASAFGPALMENR